MNIDGSSLLVEAADGERKSDIARVLEDEADCVDCSTHPALEFDIAQR